MMNENFHRHTKLNAVCPTFTMYYRGAKVIIELSFCAVSQNDCGCLTKNAQTAEAFLVYTVWACFTNLWMIFGATAVLRCVEKRLKPLGSITVCHPTEDTQCYNSQWCASENPHACQGLPIPPLKVAKESPNCCLSVCLTYDCCLFFKQRTCIFKNCTSLKIIKL